MQMQTSDCLVRVKALSSLALVMNGRTLDAKAFDLVMRNLWSNVWLMLDPSVFSFKVQETPKAQVIGVLERLGKQRLATVYRCDSDDNRSCYLVMLNQRFITKTCRRKQNVYVLSKMSKAAKHITGDLVVIDKDKCGDYWVDMVKQERIEDGNLHAEYRANMKQFEWKRIL